MLKQQNSLTSIAKTMDTSVSTISRELKRNTGKRGCRYQQANKLAYTRHQRKNKAIKLTSEVQQYIANTRFNCGWFGAVASNSKTA